MQVFRVYLPADLGVLSENLFFIYLHQFNESLLGYIFGTTVKLLIRKHKQFLLTDAV